MIALVVVKPSEVVVYEDSTARQLIRLPRDSMLSRRMHRGELVARFQAEFTPSGILELGERVR